MWTGQRACVFSCDVVGFDIPSPNPRSGDPRRRELAKQNAGRYAELSRVLRQYEHVVEDVLKHVGWLLLRPGPGELAHVRMLAQLRLLKTLLLRLVRVLMAVAMHPDRCTYLTAPRECCVRYGDRVGPAGTTSC